MIHSPEFKRYLHHRDFLAHLDLDENTRLEFYPLGQGEYNANYRFTHPKTGEELVFRINTGSQMHLSNQIDYEFSALKLLEASGRTPKAYFRDDSKKHIPYGVMVMQWLPGRPLRYETDLAKAAAILADIHSLKLPQEHGLIAPAAPAREIFEECREMASHYFSWDRAEPEVTELLHRLFEQIGRLPLDSRTTGSNCIANTELNSGNFLINEMGKSYLIDWEKPVFSEPAQDLAHFLVPTTTFWKTDTILSPAEVREFINLYRQEVGHRLDLRDLDQRFPLFFRVTCLRGISWCAMALREYSQPDRALINADTFAKILAYLTPEFLKNILENYVCQDFLRE